MTHGTASKMTTGQFRELAGAVLRSLPDDLEERIVQGWIERQDLLRRALHVALSPNGKLTTEFPVWKTLTLGTFKDVKSLKKALEKNGFHISDWANATLGQPAFTLATEETEVSLVKTTVADLGFPEGVTYREICARAKERGLELCPAEVGPQLRLQYGDQPRGEWLTIAMEPIVGSAGEPLVFNVDHDDGGRWLRTRWSDPDGFWLGDGRFVFVSK